MQPRRSLRTSIIISLAAVLILACMCTSSASVATPAPQPTPVEPVPGLAGSWQWAELVFTIQWQGDRYAVIEVTHVREGSGQLRDQTWDGKALTWTYAFGSVDPVTVRTLGAPDGDVMLAEVVGREAWPEGFPLLRASSRQPGPESLPYFDDFSDGSSGFEWILEDGDIGGRGYDQGSYFLLSANTETHQTAYAYRYFGDVVIDVDTTVTRASSDAPFYYGVGCRKQRNGAGYVFLIASDQGYEVVHYVEAGKTGSTSLTGDLRPISTAIRPGLASNHMRVTCASGLLRLEVNGELVWESTNHEMADGDLSLHAGTKDPNTPLLVRFDNLAVTQP